MLYEVTHTTAYEYTGAVSVSYHVLRLQPRELDRQCCRWHDLHIDPRPVVTKAHTDYFGNPLTFVTIEGAHHELIVTSRSRVDVSPAPQIHPADTPAWELACHSGRGGQPAGALAACEFVFPSPLLPDLPDFAAYATPSFSPRRPVLEAVLDLTRRIHTTFKFDPKATTVATPIEQVMKSRRGVCQDFAHLEIACLRSMGIPARYVSGYLETDPPPGRARLVGTDASHAWLSFFCPLAGWIDIDPTNNLLPSTRHITVAWGRDYSDVSPIRGVLLGSGEHSLKVAVDVVPIPAPEGPRPAVT